MRLYGIFTGQEKRFMRLASNNRKDTAPLSLNHDDDENMRSIVGYNHLPGAGGTDGDHNSCREVLASIRDHTRFTSVEDSPDQVDPNDALTFSDTSAAPESMVRRKKSLGGVLSATDLSNAMVLWPSAISASAGSACGHDDDDVPDISIRLSAHTAESVLDSPSKPNQSAEIARTLSSPARSASASNSKNSSGDGVDKNETSCDDASSRETGTESECSSPIPSRRLKGGREAGGNNSGGEGAPLSPLSPFHLFAGTELSPISSRLSCRSLLFPRTIDIKDEQEEVVKDGGQVKGAPSAGREGRRNDLFGCHQQISGKGSKQGVECGMPSRDRATAQMQSKCKTEEKWRDIVASLRISAGCDTQIHDGGTGGGDSDVGVNHVKCGLGHERSSSPELVSTFLSPPTLPSDDMRSCSGHGSRLGGNEGPKIGG